MTQSLTDFFKERKQRADAESAGIDWNRKKQEWLEANFSLYRQIEGFVDEARTAGNVTLQRRSKELTETHFGRYEVDELVLTVGDEEVVFSPEGGNFAGVQGRVNVRGEAGEATLVVQAGSPWQVITSRYPNLRLVDLNDETFADMLVRVMRR